jgi:ribonuclease BN (tRNA processing enzyme)
VRLSRGADVLIYDAQYTPEEYAGEAGPSRKGWGHSTFAAGAEVARAAGVKTLALFHHDPKRNDEGVAEIVKRSRALFPNTVAAREGLALRFERHPFARAQQSFGAPSVGLVEGGLKFDL